MSWETVPLGSIIMPANSVRLGHGRALPVLSMTTRDGLVEQASRFRKRIAGADLSEYKVVNRGQLVVGFPIDEAVLAFQWSHEAGIVSPAYGVWDLRDARGVDRKYLERYLRSSAAISFYRAKLRGTTLRRRTLPRGVFEAMPVPLPPLPEQRRIAAILDEADAVRVLSGAQEGKLRELLDSFFDSVAGAPGRRSVTVGDLVESSQYGTSAKAGESGQFPILRMGNVTNDGRIDLTNMKFIDIDESDHARYLVHRGDLLFNRTNSADLVGKTAVYREAEPRAFAGYLVRLRPKSPELGEYVAGYLNSRHGKLTLRKMAKSIVGMANINAREALSIRLPEPDSATLTRLLDLRQRVEAERKRLGTRRRWTDQLFASLQHRAFRGEL